MFYQTIFSKEIWIFPYKKGKSVYYCCLNFPVFFVLHCSFSFFNVFLLSCYTCHFYEINLYFIERAINRISSLDNNFWQKKLFWKFLESPIGTNCHEIFLNFVLIFYRCLKNGVRNCFSLVLIVLNSKTTETPGCCDFQIELSEKRTHTSEGLML